MSKELNIGSMKFSIPDYNTDVGKAVEFLQNQYEAGNIRAIFLVCATKASLHTAVVGDGMIKPLTAIAANAMSAMILDEIEGTITGETDDE